jgi:hypothetical protein
VQRGFGPSLPLPEQQVDHPAPADVRTTPTQVGQQVGVVAAGILERVGQDRQPVERPVGVDRPGTELPSPSRPHQSYLRDRLAAGAADVVPYHPPADPDATPPAVGSVGGFPIVGGNGVARKGLRRPTKSRSVVAVLDDLPCVICGGSHTLCLDDHALAWANREYVPPPA